MYSKSIGFLVFSGRPCFSEMINNLLNCLGASPVIDINTDNVIDAANNLREIERKIIIFDADCRNHEARKLIFNELCISEHSYCLYICNYKTDKLYYVTHPKVIYLTRISFIKNFNRVFLASVFHLYCPMLDPIYKNDN
jgi:hypothetical protein